MSRTEVTRTIEAPIEAVFETIAHIENYSKVVPYIKNVEFLSDVHSGVGARFRETRLMGKREASTILEITEYEPNDRVRMVSDQGGTIWDTVFTTKQVAAGKVELTMVMDAKAYKFYARLINPMIKGFIQRAIEKDLDAVKAHCEA